MRKILVKFLPIVLVILTNSSGFTEGTCWNHSAVDFFRFHINAYSNQDVVGGVNSSLSCPSPNITKISLAFHINWTEGVENLGNSPFNYFMTLNKKHNNDPETQLTFKDVNADLNGENLLKITIHLRCVSNHFLQCIASINKLLEKFKAKELFNFFFEFGIETKSNTGEWKISQDYKFYLMIFRLECG